MRRPGGVARVIDEVFRSKPWSHTEFFRCYLEMTVTLAPWPLYALAALFEIGGCFAFWNWLRNGQPAWWALPGIAALVIFAWLLTCVPVNIAGRTFAAYGGVYIAASLGWLALVEQQPLQRADLLGGIVCLAGAGIILLGARH